ncbi:MAG: hypothetical protein J1F33_06035 [Clostridiales bacterium]|nr:hypothetical protein [Clostridiales bacterium]
MTGGKPNDVQDKIDIKQFAERLKSLFGPVGLCCWHSVVAVHQYEKSKNAVFSAGMRYCQAEELIKSLMLDATFQNIFAVERSWIIERILDEIKGRMMGDIVLLETKMRSNKQVL